MIRAAEASGRKRRRRRRKGEKVEGEMVLVTVIFTFVVTSVLEIPPALWDSDW